MGLAAAGSGGLRPGTRAHAGLGRAGGLTAARLNGCVAGVSTAAGSFWYCAYAGDMARFMLAWPSSPVFSSGSLRMSFGVVALICFNPGGTGVLELLGQPQEISKEGGGV